MEKESIKEIITIIIAAIVLALAVSFPNSTILLTTSIFFIVIIAVNVVVKKIIAYSLEANVTIKFWSWYQYGWRKDSHFKSPVPMFWLPVVLSFITRGFFYWLSILEFDITPRTERVSKKHGLYRFSEITDWHTASIACFGISANLILAILGYIFASFYPSLELFARLNIYYAFWSIIPLSSMDGNKILFGSKLLWFIFAVITTLALVWSLIIV